MEKIEDTSCIFSNLLTNEILNSINKGIIIISKSCTINYHNILGINFIKTITNDIYTNSFINKKINIIIPQFDFLESSLHENKLFKNKIINLELELNDKIQNYELTINSIIENDLIKHIFFINNNTQKFIFESKNQNNFIAFLSHELRNPLQSLSMATYLLSKNITTDDSKTNLYISTINKSSNEMKRIINDVLDLSKIEYGDIELIIDNYIIVDIIDNLINTFTILLQEKNIILDISYNNCPKTIFTDLTRINQILANLLSNAIKYSHNNSKININILYDKRNHGVNFEIIDFGLGIHKDQYCNIFKENGKTTNSYKFDVKSNGFGLFLSQKIALLLEGNITFKSEYTKGSTFIFFHPIKLGTSINTIKNKEHINGIEGNILIIDDDYSNLIMFKMLLEIFIKEYNLKLKIDIVQDGLSAIQICDSCNYNLIFTDINMNNIDGCTIARTIKEKYDIPIIATTGNIMAKSENQNNVDSDKYKYFDKIIIKPYDEQNILSILNSYLC